MAYTTYNDRYAGTGAGGQTITKRMLDPVDVLPLQQGQALDAQSKYQFGNGLSKGPSQAARDNQTLASIPVNAQMTRFNTILPYLTGQLSAAQSGMAGGQNTPTPEITVGGVLNPQQVQQQVNSSRAANDQATAGKIQQSNQSVAGRGFGSNSPLAMALNQGYQNQNLATNTQNETQTRLAAATGNASHLLDTQKARANTAAQWNDLDIKRKQPYFSQSNALISALAGMA